MATLFEYYLGPETHLTRFYGVVWYAQTFTPLISHTISAVQIYAAKAGSPGDMTISIRTTSSGLPTGLDLTSGSVSANDWSGVDWREVAVTPYKLVVGTQYAKVLRAISGDISTNYVSLRFDQSGEYARGTKCDSSDSGDSWSKISGADLLFREYGAYGSGELAGLYAVVEERFHYVDAYGNERYIQGTAV